MLLGLKSPWLASSMLTGVLNTGIFQSLWRFVQLSLRPGAWTQLLNAAVWQWQWCKCLSWNTSCIFSPGWLMSVRAGGSAGALHTGRSWSWVCWVFGSSWEGLNVSRRKWQPCLGLLLHLGASGSSPKSEGLSWTYTLVFFLCYIRALCRFWIAVGRETQPQRCSFLCLQKFLSLREGRYIALPKQRLWDWLWEYTVRQH